MICYLFFFLWYINDASYNYLWKGQDPSSFLFWIEPVSKTGNKRKIYLLRSRASCSVFCKLDWPVTGLDRSLKSNIVSSLQFKARILLLIISDFFFLPCVDMCVCVLGVVWVHCMGSTHLSHSLFFKFDVFI